MRRSPSLAVTAIAVAIRWHVVGESPVRGGFLDLR